MVSAIYFNYKFLLNTGKIDNVIAYDMLPAKMETTAAGSSQIVPQQGFTRSQVAAVLLGKGLQYGIKAGRTILKSISCITFFHQQHPSPLCYPPLGEGQGGALLRILFVILDEFGHYLFHVTHDDIVGNLVDGSLGVVVDRDDDA